MIDLREHLLGLRGQLRSASPLQGDRFAAWCCLPLADDARVAAFLDERAPGLARRVRRELEVAWRGETFDAAVADALWRLEWDADVADGDDEAPALLATDLRTAVAFLRRWQASRDPAHLAACAQSLVNAIDYLHAFELLDPAVARPVEGELDAQRRFAGELLADAEPVRDRHRHHEWLYGGREHARRGFEATDFGAPPTGLTRPAAPAASALAAR